jgi:hypothetical protein
MAEGKSPARQPPGSPKGASGSEQQRCGLIFRIAWIIRIWG